ncbi:MAG TPA: nitroreductase family protein [Bacteroidales bacterium]|nr:nitroreductase family protein [Bacteroidales bacterium]
MDNLLELLRHRRSTRKFMETEISPELVEKLMQAALMSPASKSSNPWQFILVDQREMLSALSNCKKAGSKPIENCSLAVVVIADPEKSDVWVEDTSIASIYLQLEAEDLGLGSCWIQIRNRQNAEGEDSEVVVKRLLEIPDNFRVESIIVIGMKEVSKSPYDLDNLSWEKVHIGKFNINE